MESMTLLGISTKIAIFSAPVCGQYIRPLILAGLIAGGCLCSLAQAADPVPVKGVILKLNDAGVNDSNPIEDPLTTNPAAVVAKLNAENVGEVRVQVNDRDTCCVSTDGANAINTLASLGYAGRVIIDNKKWYLNQTERYTGWAQQMYDTYQQCSPAGKALVAGYSFGETTPDTESWNQYATGVQLAVAALQSLFAADDDPTNDEAMAGMKIFVGGASYNCSFRYLTASQHADILAAVEAVDATLVYAYKSFHTMQANPQPEEGQEDTLEGALDFMNNTVGLANLATVAGSTQVQYRGDGGDKITNNANRYSAILINFQQNPTWVHAGAQKLKGDLFNDDGSVINNGWNKLNNFFAAIDDPPNDVCVNVPLTLVQSFNINTNTNNRPFFTEGGSNGYVGDVATGASSSSTVVRERITLVGSATVENGYADGNGIPVGVAISCDVSFTVTATAGLLTDGGNNGLGIDSGTGEADQLDPGEQLYFGPITLSNVVFRDPRNLLLRGTTSLANPSWNVLRSNDFNEAAEGAFISSDATGLQDVSGFGVAGAGQIQNDFNAGTFGPLPAAYLTTTTGAWRLKGIGYQFEVNFALNAITSFNADIAIDGCLSGPLTPLATDCDLSDIDCDADVDMLDIVSIQTQLGI